MTSRFGLGGISIGIAHTLVSFAAFDEAGRTITEVDGGIPSLWGIAAVAGTWKETEIDLQQAIREIWSNYKRMSRD